MGFAGFTSEFREAIAGFAGFTNATLAPDTLQVYRPRVLALR